MTTHDTAAALEAAIDALIDAEDIDTRAIVASERGEPGPDIDATERNACGARRDLHRAITAHVEAEVARRMAAAPDVEQWLGGIVSRALRGCSGPGARADLMAEVDRLRAAIAADKARAVEFAVEDAAKPLARRMAAEEMLTATMIAYVVSGLRKVGLLRVGPGDIDATTWARLVEAIDDARRVPPDLRDKARPTRDEARPVGRVADHLRQLATEVDPPRMADGFEADRMRLLAHRLRDVAAMLPDADEARRLVDEHERAVLVADGYATARTALLRALGVEA